MLDVYLMRAKDILNIDNVAEIEIAGNMVHLVATYNPDAMEPIQREDYSSPWILPKKAFREKNTKGFFDLFLKINAEVAGGIYLTDNLTRDDINQIMDETDIYMCKDAEVGNLLSRLKDGKYTLYIV